MSDRETVHVPGDALLNPMALASIALLLVNDHLLKAMAPGFVTGKLSDFAGLAFFPLFLLGAWEILLAACGRWRGPTIRSLAAAVAGTAVAFAFIKTTDFGSAAFALVLGSLQWLGASGWSALTLAPAPRSQAVAVAQDPSDLIALVALVVALAIGSARLSGGTLRLVPRRLS